jgi:Protein of unknown function (DUF3108)
MSCYRFLVLVLWLVSSKSLAQPDSVAMVTLTPFTLTYNATYNKLNANVTRTLSQQTDASWLLGTEIQLKLLNRTVSTISESSLFSLNNGQLQSQLYQYQQSGLGKRSRSAEFNKASQQIRYQQNEQQRTLPYVDNIYDSLNSQLVLSQAFSRGETSVSLQVMERGNIREQRYRVLDQDPLQTSIGLLQAIHIRRERDPGSDRQTEFWLAPAYGYAIIKLKQVEADGDRIMLEITGGTLNGKPLPSNATAK